MKEAASDVFQIEVVEVEVIAAETVRKSVLIHAKLLGVERSSGKLMRGERIEIASYLISATDATDLKEQLEALVALVGPKAPPETKPGWKGTVYLNAQDLQGDVKKYNIAVFGHSFERAVKDGDQK